VQDHAAAEQDVVLETQAAFLSLVSARESARVLSEAVEAYEAHLRDVRNRQDLGLSAANEVLAVTVERERAELARLTARNADAVATANLVRLTDLPPGTVVEPEPPAASDAATPDLEPLVAAALAGRPELVGLHARGGAADAQVRVAHAAGLPQVGLSAGWDYANPNQRILPLRDEWKDTWSVGAGLSWNAFDGGRTRAATAQARAQADALRQDAIEMERRVRVEVTSRALDVSTALAARDVARRATEAATENLRVVQDRYQEGVVSSSDLLDAENVLLRAHLEETQATSQLHLARAALDRAVGR
jgi:outer membrane protein